MFWMAVFVMLSYLIDQFPQSIPMHIYQIHTNDGKCKAFSVSKADRFMKPTCGTRETSEGEKHTADRVALHMFVSVLNRYWYIYIYIYLACSRVLLQVELNTSNVWNKTVNYYDSYYFDRTFVKIVFFPTFMKKAKYWYHLAPLFGAGCLERERERGGFFCLQVLVPPLYHMYAT